MMSVRDVPLSQWTIYDRPPGYPDSWIARRQELRPGRTVPTGDVIIGKSLDEVRRKLPRNLYRIERHPSDDVCVVEVWI